MLPTVFINGIEEELEGHIRLHFSASLKAEPASTQVYKSTQMPFGFALRSKRRRYIDGIARWLSWQVTNFPLSISCQCFTRSVTFVHV